MSGLLQQLGLLGQNNADPNQPAMTEAERQRNLDIAKALFDHQNRFTQPVGPDEYKAIHWTQGAADILRYLAGRNIQDRVWNEQRRAGSAEIGAVPQFGTLPTTTRRPTNAPRDQGANTNIAPTSNERASSSRLGADTSFIGLGADTSFIERLIQIESGGNPRARTGSYRGLGQFGPQEERRYGITNDNWTDPTVQRRALERHTQFLTGEFTKRMGREPTQGELYLAHQQGPAGAPALLEAGNTPAWRAIRPFYRSDRMAQLAIYGNIPDGHPLKNRQPDQIPASEFTQLWTSRFPSNPSTQVAQGPEINRNIETGSINPPPGTTLSNLERGVNTDANSGLPALVAQHFTERDPLPTRPGVRVAQVQPGQSPAPISDATAPGQPLAPQAAPVGPAAGPHAQQLEMLQQQFNDPRIPVERRLELAKQYMGLFAPAQQAQDLSVGDIHTKQNFYFDPRTGQNVPIPMGPNNRNRPQQQGNNTPATNPSITPDLPQFPQGGNVEDLATWNAQYGAQRNIANRMAEAQQGVVASAIQRGTAAPAFINTLNTMDNASRAGGGWRGPGSSWALEASRFLSNFGWGTSEQLAKLPFQELIVKLNTQLGSLASQSLSSNPTQFNFQTFLASNPGLAQSEQGMRMLIDVLKQERQHEIDLGRQAARLRPGQFGEWQNRVDTYFRTHPTIINVPAYGNQPARKIWTGPVETQEDYNRIPVGTQYMGSNGQLITKRAR